MPLHPVLKRSALFRQMTDEEIIAALRMTGTKEHVYEKGAVILSAGEPVTRIGFVFQGSVVAERTDGEGTRLPVARIEPGRIFAETAAILSDEPLPVTYTAAERTRVLFFRVGVLRETGRSVEPSLMKLAMNLMTIAARNNAALSERAFHTAPKTIRGRVLSYLNAVSIQKQSRTFEIPYDRRGLAEYLNVDRSALSKELSKLQAEGRIETKKNRFVLLEKASANEKA